MVKSCLHNLLETRDSLCKLLLDVAPIKLVIVDCVTHYLIISKFVYSLFSVDMTGSFIG